MSKDPNVQDAAKELKEKIKPVTEIPKPKPNGFKVSPGLLGLVVLGAAGGYYYYYNYMRKPEPIIKPTT